MLRKLKFRNVGPAPELALEFGSRLNFVTGDNGLGKTFVLDAAWWALTRTWARGLLRPEGPPSRPAIEYRYRAQTGKNIERTIEFDRGDERWKLPRGRPPIPGLVLYAQVDGGFSVWDPARNYWRNEEPERPADSFVSTQAYRFSNQAVWEGLPLDRVPKQCNGLIADWANWQIEDGEAAKQLRAVLDALSPSEQERLEPGDLVKLSVWDARRHPTIRTPYGLDVPLVHASAGIRRIAALAYLLVWAWQEHVASAKLRGDPCVNQIVFLIDEIEAHLHPKWQRRIVPALLRVMKQLTETEDVGVQLIAATHSPLVLASAEADWNERSDLLWELRLDDGQVSFSPAPWERRGDVNAWLTSSVFDLEEPRSLEAERAIHTALELFRRAERPVGARTRRGGRSAAQHARGDRPFLDSLDPVPEQRRHIAVIPVTPAPEPSGFDASVRRPGRNEVARRRAEGVPREALHKDLPDHWRKALPDLMDAYRETCAYCCFWIRPGVETPTVDHMTPKSKDVDLAYEWSNFRLALLTFNGRKGDHLDVLDPFMIQADWFRLELWGFQVCPGESVPESVRRKVDATIERLKLNEHKLRGTRRYYADRYWAKGCTLADLRRENPFVARELERQDRLLEGDAPASDH